MRISSTLHNVIHLLYLYIPMPVFTIMQSTSSKPLHSSLSQCFLTVSGIILYLYDYLVLSTFCHISYPTPNYQTSYKIVDGVFPTLFTNPGITGIPCLFGIKSTVAI